MELICPVASLNDAREWPAGAVIFINYGRVTILIHLGYILGDAGRDTHIFEQENGYKVRLTKQGRCRPVPILYVHTFLRLQ